MKSGQHMDGCWANTPKGESCVVCLDILHNEVRWMMRWVAIKWHWARFIDKVRTWLKV